MRGYNKEIMQRVINLAAENARSGAGGPFAAAIVKKGEVISIECNMVVNHLDPTAHAEVQAIRSACRLLRSFELKDCDLYTNCEPCPMCFGAIYWAKIKRVYYSSTKQDASNAGFDDALIYNQIDVDPKNRLIPFIKHRVPNTGAEWIAWDEVEDKAEY